MSMCWIFTQFWRLLQNRLEVIEIFPCCVCCLSIQTFLDSLVGWRVTKFAGSDIVLSQPGSGPFIRTVDVSNIIMIPPLLPVISHYRYQPLNCLTLHPQHFTPSSPLLSSPHGHRNNIKTDAAF